MLKGSDQTKQTDREPPNKFAICPLTQDQSSYVAKFVSLPTFACFTLRERKGPLAMRASHVDLGLR